MTRRIAAASAIPILLPALLAAQPRSPMEVVNSFHAASAAGDSATVLRLLDPDVLVFESGGVERSRAEYQSHHMGADMAYAAAVKREVVRQTHEIVGDLAIVLSETRATGTFREREVNSRGVETMVLRRTREGWRIVHIHWSSGRTAGG